MIADMGPATITPLGMRKVEVELYPQWWRGWRSRLRQRKLHPTMTTHETYDILPTKPATQDADDLLTYRGEWTIPEGDPVHVLAARLDSTEGRFSFTHPVTATGRPGDTIAIRCSITVDVV